MSDLDDHSSAAFIAEYKSASTRYLHRHNLRQYESWLVAHEVAVQDAREGEILEFLDSKRDTLKASTVDAILKSIRAYYKWLYARGAIPRNPAANVRTSTPRMLPPKSVALEDIRRMLEAALNDRHRAFVAVLACTALRVTELINCDVSDLEYESDRCILHFRPLGNDRRRPTFVVLSPELAQLVQLQLDGRRQGALFPGLRTPRLTRGGGADIVAKSAIRAGLNYPVGPQMLTQSLPAIAIQHGFSYRAVVRAIGIPDRRHSERWLGAASHHGEDNASVRLAGLLLADPDSAEFMLAQAEGLRNESDLPEAFAVAGVGSVIERHLRLLASEHGIEPQSDSSKGGITYYVGELQRKKVVSVTDGRKFRALGDLRNDAAHGWFERVPPGSSVHVLRDARDLLERYPLPESGT